MLVSPPILAATKEPILTAFSVSNKLYILAKRREEYRDIYSSLAQEVKQHLDESYKFQIRSRLMTYGVSQNKKLLRSYLTDLASV